MDKLPKDLAHIVDNLCREGDRFAQMGQYFDAIEKYNAAWEVLPEPRWQWPAATWILMSVGDCYFREKDYASGALLLFDALDCPGGEQNPFIYLRLGQCYFERGELNDAADALEEAYRLGGVELFADEDPKYLGFVNNQLKIMNIAPQHGRFNNPLK